MICNVDQQDILHKSLTIPKIRRELFDLESRIPRKPAKNAR